ncbi:hypothetical protein DSO57_1024147 [Entomophthora muscae]|uniref:Uncharacterized protein n=1 Tax=Entomophthora muscae TaxID=34485 RepID=A0ACC2UCU2_9FUNG|nr:hypothetical protein DSO57_1024147 [Entomophthora muscae]
MARLGPGLFPPLALPSGTTSYPSSWFLDLNFSRRPIPHLLKVSQHQPTGPELLAFFGNAAKTYPQAGPWAGILAGAFSPTRHQTNPTQVDRSYAVHIALPCTHPYHQARSTSPQASPTYPESWILPPPAALGGEPGAAAGHPG